MEDDAKRVLCALAGEHDWVAIYEPDDDLVITECARCGEIDSIEPREYG